MIKYLLRKTLLKDFSKQHQDQLLNSKVNIFGYLLHYFLLLFVLPILLVVPIILLIIPIYFFSDPDQYTTKNIIMSIGFITLTLPYVIFIINYIINNNEKIKEFIGTNIVKKINFLLFTKRGKALSKGDFNTIMSNRPLYTHMKYFKVLGKCYCTCFTMLEVLKKGKMIFIIVKRMSISDDIYMPDKKYYIHVLYVNNGWVYDTDYNIQYPLKDLNNYHVVKDVYEKEFYYDDIKYTPYEKFVCQNRPIFEEWADKNDSISFTNDE